MAACGLAERPSTSEFTAPARLGRGSVDLACALGDATLHTIDRVLLACFRRAELPAEEDLEDIRSDVLTRLLSNVRSLDTSRIRDLQRYLTTVAVHCFFDFLRARDPSHAAMEARLRSVVAENPQLAIWRDHGAVVVGLDAWRVVRGQSPRELPPLALHSRDIRPATLGASLVRLLADLGAPVDRDVLVDRLAELLSSSYRAAAAEASVRAPPQHAELDRREALTRLWGEIEILPPRQRRALLLGARDESGESVLVLLHARRVATAAELSSCLQLSPEALRRIWSSLPLDDLRIARLVGVSKRQKVINLRKSARQRLARRTHRG